MKMRHAISIPLCLLCLPVLLGWWSIGSDNLANAADPESTVSGGTGDFLENMMLLKRARTRRASSWDRSGDNVDAFTIRSGETETLAEVDGPGCIQHIYFTTNHNDPYYMRKCILRMYWDGETSPSVEVPLGDFFGLGFCETRYFESLLVTTAPGTEGPHECGRLIGLNSYFPMPFATGARITLENDSEGIFGACWYHVDYEVWDEAPESLGRFHAQWRRENPTQPRVPENPKNLDGKDNYVILEAQGWGNYVGMFLNVDNITGGWYGEGDDMIFVDDDVWPPSLHGTGSEEIFGGGACPNVEYATPYTGYHLVSNKNFAGKQSMYRFCVNDPVRFKESIRVTIEHGLGNNLGNDYSSTAFWYQTEPHAPFPKLLPRNDRLPRMDKGRLKVYMKELESLQILSEYATQADDILKLIENMGDDWKTYGQLSNVLSAALNQKDYDAAYERAVELREFMKRFEK